MRDEDCVSFLQWCLPRLNKRWEGFRKVRRQVCKRITRRMQDLRLRSTADYRAYLEAHPGEWGRLDAMCRITISRFYRDRGVFDMLRRILLSELAERAQSRGDEVLAAWSAGCASGEEVYTLKIIWEQALRTRHPDLSLRITATDAQEHMLHRARRGHYPPGTLKELPEDWRGEAFEEVDDEEPYRLQDIYRRGITWKRQDIREEMPAGPFDLVFCRNLVFTYFDEPLQRRCLQAIAERMRPGSLLILGKHETLPPGVSSFQTRDAHKHIYERR